MDGEHRSAFGSLLRAFRMAAGLSQEELAERARMSAAGISALERGARRAPYRATVTLLARALNLSAPEREQLENSAARRPLGAQNGGRAQQAATPPNNLPLATGSFLGREAELTEIERLADLRRLITLTGPGGVGKTRLALQAATVALRHFPDGVWFVDLAPLTDGALVSRAVAQAVGICEVSERPGPEGIVEALRRKQLMLVLDNCEHLIDAVAELAATVLPSCPNLRILVTSREQLRISGEQCFAVAPFDVPPPGARLTAADAMRYAAFALFVERARAADPGFRISAEHVAPIADICRRLDGIPLAIELAAARAPLLSPAEIAGRLDSRFRLLTDGSRATIPRQQTLRAAIDWSYQLLEPVEQLLFRRLGIFAGRFGFEAVSAVCAPENADEFTVLDLLASLIDKSLVITTGTEAGRQRYRLLESTRLYARERLDDGGETGALRPQLAEHVRAAARKAIADGDVDEIRWTDRIEADLDNIRAVLDWAIADGCNLVFGAELVDELWRYWIDTGKFLEVKRHYDRILDRGSDLDDSLAGKILLTHGLLASRRWDVDEGRKSLERALVLLRPLGDEHQIARALNGLAITYQELGDLERAAALYTESLEIARRLQEPRALATVLMNLGVLTEVYLAEYQRAEELYVECLGVAREHGDTAQQAHVLQNLAELSLGRDHYDLAVVYAEESLPLWRAHRNGEYVAVGQVLIGVAELARGRRGAARSALLEALPPLAALHHGAALVSLFVGLADLALSDSHDEIAVQFIGFALALSETMLDNATVRARKAADRLVLRARERMEDAVFDAFVRRGRSLSLSQAADLATTAPALS